MNETITEDGEVVSTSLATIDDGMAIGLARAEIDTLVSTARAYPRSMTVAQRRMIDLATFDEDAADEAIYSLPRAGKALEGPSIRFAEMAAQSFGNCRIAARTVVVDRKEKFVEAEGVFLDAETNVATLARIRRRISGKNGQVFSDDMILVTSNAAQSIARRNAILAGIPKTVWKKAYEAARNVVMGDIKTLANRRAEALQAFTRFGLTAEEVFQLLGVKGEEDIDQERLVPLRGMFSALRNQETTVEELRRQITPQRIERQTANPLADDDGPTNTGKPAAGKSGSERQTEPAGEGAAGGKEPAEPDAITIARGLGRAAKKKGQARKAMPPEYREEERKAEADAWLAGYDDDTPSNPPNEGTSGRKG